MPCSIQPRQKNIDYKGPLIPFVHTLLFDSKSAYNCAVALGLEKEAGKKAGLLFIDADPSENIANIEKISLVFKKEMRYYSPKLLQSVRGKVGQYGKLAFCQI